MIQRTIILYKCFNQSFGERLIETDEFIPTPERALELFKKELKSTPLGKQSPELIEKYSIVEEKPLVLFGVILDDEKTLKSI